MSDTFNKQMVLQRSLERAMENFKKIGRANLTPSKIRTRIAALQGNWAQYQDGHAHLLTVIAEPVRTSMAYFQDNQFDATEEAYQATWEYMTECLEEIEPVVSSNRSLDASTARSDDVALSVSQLPHIRLPPFEGSYAEWEGFRDRFTALIIRNKSLCDFSRMHYLASSLKGRALDSISNIAITADNFAIAWQTLTARFENKRRIIASHFSSLLGLTGLTRESASELQGLCDKLNIAVASLRGLDRTPSDLWNDFLVHLLSHKLDPASRKAWNLKTSDSDSPPTYEELSRFLSTRIRALEECNPTAPAKAPKSSASSRVHVANASAPPSTACPLCKARHYLSACSKFVAQSPSQRRVTVKELKRCFNCLSAAHAAHECKSQYNCRTCRKRHHSMLHVDSDSDATSVASQASVTSSVAPVKAISEITSLLASAKPRSSTQVLLATARIKISGSGRTLVVRALMDQGSEATFISESLAQNLRVKRIRMPTTISAVGGVQLGAVRHASEITVSSIHSSTPSFTTTALILSSLTSYAPKRAADLSTLEHLAGLSWADPDPTGSDPIHIIIGADLYSRLLLEGIKRGADRQPFAQNSVFGWIISGPLDSTVTSSSAHINLTVHHCIPLSELSTDISRFWEIEEVPHCQIAAPLDEQCEAHFRLTHSRTPDGRYVVRLPFKTDPPINIGHSRQTAERLYQSLSRRLNVQPDLKCEYHKFMRDYEDLGHMRLVPESHDTSHPQVYIPHHPVFRADSLTSHLRVVFNASSTTSNGTSLNDHLLAGPKLQTELPAILLQWRQHRFVYSADIAKMYRQILVDERDRDYQRILWQHDSYDHPSEYQLLTVTYGMTCAPYLAQRALKKLTEDEGTRFPLAVPILHNQIYVDDVLFGDDDRDSLRQRRDQLIALLQCGKFELRKWASNSADLLSDIDPANHGLACSLPIALDERVKVLGIVWNPSSDVFNFKVNLSDAAPCCKRTILSTIAKLYDPLGWVTPVTVAAKILMQALWRSKLEWDQDLTPTLLNQWQPIYEKLLHLNDVTIPRWTHSHSLAATELHGFADASTQAYAASVYLKITSPSGESTISLIAGKSKVAPIKPLTIPRLELSAALLLSRLLRFVQDVLLLHSVPCTCWTDSTVTLSWLRSHPSRWTTFVANRVATVQSTLPNAVWRYVPTSENPADCASRGLLGDELVTHPLWWHGPPWLRSPSENWPQEPTPPLVDAPAEEKRCSHNITEAPIKWDLEDRYSSWTKLIRVTAYLLRFIAACRKSNRDRHEPGRASNALHAGECALAKLVWIRRIQSELFPAELTSLSSRRAISSKSPLISLHPFIDRDRVLRVGGRLRNAPLPYDTRHPILLAPHPLVRLIIAQAHKRTLHAGLQLTLSTLRCEYWILRARNIIRSIIRECVACTRERAVVPLQLMGDLPTARVTPSSRSFSHCGVDYAGPVRVRASAGRGITTRKAYISLFVCLSTRAIHLELVGDYSTPAFMSAFTRFCSRRGLPQAMYSDNGTTFTGADKELRNAYLTATQDPTFLSRTACDGIKWHFIPPSAPHFGGLWEAGVRSVKHHLRRVLGSHTLTYEEFSTLLSQIEACLNSRPIAPLSDSPDDYQCLTPGHFLIGSAITVPPEPSTLHLAENRLSRWQTVRRITEQFWKLWTSDYVNTLQQRNKWQKTQPSIDIGRLVLLRNSLLPPCKWDLGRITRLHPGSDGLTRVVTVKTATSEYVRPIGKLCILPIDSSISEPRAL